MTSERFKTQNVKGTHASAALLGAAAGIPTGAVMASRGLPIESLNWVIEHGFTGFSIVIAMVTTAAFLREKAGRLADVERCQQEKDGLNTRYQSEKDAIQALRLKDRDDYQLKLEIRDANNASQSRKFTKVMSALLEILRGKQLSAKEVKEIKELDGDDTDEDLKMPRTIVGGDA